MAGKQSLYELLGLTDKASPQDIRDAFEARRREVEASPDGEERRNRLSFLRHALDVLGDPRQRALYDRHGRDQRAAVALRAARSARPAWPVLLLLLLVGAAYPAWRKR